MTTRFQDAASIIGVALAKTLVEDEDEKRRRKARLGDGMIVKAHQAHRGHQVQPLGFPIPTARDTLDALRRHNGIVSRHNVYR
jgi:hypothetical protein